MGVLRELLGRTLDDPPKFVHPPLADFHSSFSSAAGGGRLASLMSSIYYSFPNSSEGLI